MIRVHPFNAIDLEWIRVQPAQLEDWPPGSARTIRARAFEEGYDARTIRGEDGTILCCMGLMANHDQCMTCWSVVAEAAGPALLDITRWIRKYLASLDVRRFDLVVRGKFANGHQWARLLGFSPEGIQRHWYPNGDDLHVYARLKGQN